MKSAAKKLFPKWAHLTTLSRANCLNLILSILCLKPNEIGSSRIYDINSIIKQLQFLIPEKLLNENYNNTSTNGTDTDANGDNGSNSDSSDSITNIMLMILLLTLKIRYCSS